MKPEHWGTSALLEWTAPAAMGWSVQVEMGEKWIRCFMEGVCHVLEMRRRGPVIIEWFGGGSDHAGYSAHQWIETSHISGHFVAATRQCFLDVFSCRDFEVNTLSGYIRGIWRVRPTIVCVISRG